MSEASTSMDSEELVTVGRFPDLATAGMAQAALESAGIESMLTGGNATGLIPYAFESLLQVRPEDEPGARALLDQAQTAPMGEAEVLAAEQAAEGSTGAE